MRRATMRCLTMTAAGMLWAAWLTAEWLSSTTDDPVFDVVDIIVGSVVIVVGTAVLLVSLTKVMESAGVILRVGREIEARRQAEKPCPRCSPRRADVIPLNRIRS